MIKEGSIGNGGLKAGISEGCGHSLEYNENRLMLCPVLEKLVARELNNR